MTQPPPPGGWPPPRPVGPPPMPAPLGQPPMGPPPGQQRPWPGPNQTGQLPGPHQTGQLPGPHQTGQLPGPYHTGPLPPPRPVMPPPQPSWGPQGFQPYPMMPPPKKSSGPIVALVLFVVVLLGIAGIGVVAANSSDRVADAGYSGYSSYSPTYTASETTTTTTTTTETSSSRTSSTRSSPTSTTPAGPKAVIRLADHPIHRNEIGAMPVNGCPLPAMDYSPAGQDKFLRAALPCIEAMWKPAMQRANLPYQPVEFQIVTQNMSYPCGTVKADSTARYCQGAIYWTALNYANDNSPNHPGKYLGQLAHEYGHHIQWLSGLLKASGNAQYDAGGWDTEKGLDLNRRMELQATCFGGMTLAPLSHGAIPNDVINTALQDAGIRGDYPQYPYRDHGTPERNSAWVNHGYKNNSAAACNTWAAGAAEVA